MKNLLPSSITRPKPYLLCVAWDDGAITTIALRILRENCPCAVCKGETILGTTYTFGLQIMKPGMYELESLVPSGNYGVQVFWADGHSTGIYTWELLYTICFNHRLSEEDLTALQQQEQQP